MRYKYGIGTFELPQNILQIFFSLLWQFQGNRFCHCLVFAAFTFLEVYTVGTDKF